MKYALTALLAAASVVVAQLDGVPACAVSFNLIRAQISLLQLS